MSLNVVDSVELVSTHNNGKIKVQSQYNSQRRPPLLSRNTKSAICIGYFPGSCLLSTAKIYLISMHQHEAHEASLKLQKHSLDSSRLHERTRELESENTRLKEEIIVLRDHPDDQPHPDTFRLRELEIEYRRLGDQLACVFPCITTPPFQLYFTTML